MLKCLFLNYYKSLNQLQKYVKCIVNSIEINILKTKFYYKIRVNYNIKKNQINTDIFIKFDQNL